MDDETVERILRWLLSLDPGLHLLLQDEERDETLDLADTVVDEALREAVDRWFLRGNRANHGPRKRWSSLEISALGLRFIGEWPPPGREHHDGPWNQGHWSLHARPLLERVRDGSYRHDMLIGLHVGASPDEWE